MKCFFNNWSVKILATISVLVPCARLAADELPAMIAETTLISSVDDKAGVWGVFGPGDGRLNDTSYDWHLRFSFYVSKELEIKSITFLHDQIGYPEEGWSSSSEQYFNKQLYPLVVFTTPEAHILKSNPPIVTDDFGHQLNTDYDQSLGTYAVGDHELDLYAQIENPEFGGGRLIVKTMAGGEFTFLVAPRKDNDKCLISEEGEGPLSLELYEAANTKVKLRAAVQTAEVSANDLKSEVKRLKKKIRALKSKKH